MSEPCCMADAHGKACNCRKPFIRPARAQTMMRDFSRLRDAIRSHDSEAAEAAWEKCERWIDCIDPNPVPHPEQIIIRGTIS